MLFLIGGMLMVVGAGMYVFAMREVASWIFLVGALLFATMQIRQRYEGTDFVIRRLRRITILADVLFVLAGLLMVECAYGFVTYIYNKWVVVLLIAAILEVYTTHRISHELDKEAKKR